MRSRIVCIAAFVVLVASAAAGWRIDTLRQGNWYERIALARTPAGEWAATYGNHDVRYASYDGTAWAFEVASTDGCVGDQSLAFDGAHPVIAYVNGALKVARFDGSAWQVETVDDSSEFGYDVSLAIDGAGNMSIAYYDAVGFDLEYAYWDGTSWSLETVDAAGQTGRGNSLTLDAAGLPAISYRQGAGAELRVARKLAGVWELTTVIAGSAVANATSIARSPLGLVVGYARTGGSEAGIYVVEWDGVAWSSPHRLDDVSTSAQNVGVAVRASGEVVVGWVALDRKTVREGVGRGVTWSVRDAVPDDRTIEGFALALDETEQSAFAYVQQGTWAKLAAWDGSGWPIVEVEKMADAASGVAIAVDLAGYPAVAFNPSFEPIKLARWDGSAWQIEDVPGVTFSSEVALGFGADGHPLLVTATTGEIRLSRFDGSSWSTEVVTIYSGALERLQMAHDGRGEVVISYREWANRDLYVVRNESGWVVDLIHDDATNGGGLAIDRDGNPALAYHPGLDLELARFDGTLWSYEPLPTLVTTNGASPALGFRPDGTPAIAFGDFRTLEYGAYDGSAWVQEQADPVGRPGEVSGIVFDPLGNPAVGYHKYADGIIDYRFARHDGVAWAAESIESGFISGGFQGARVLRVAVLPDGTPVVAYYQLCEREVHVAWGTPLGVEINLHRGVVASLVAGWKATALPLTELNDDETAPFPVLTDLSTSEPDCPVANPLTTYRYLQAAVPLGNGLGIVPDGSCAPDGVTVSWQ